MIQRILGVAIAAVLLTVGINTASAQSNVTLRIACYGGSFTASQKKYAADLYTTRTGVKVEFVDGNPSDHLAKLVASRGREAPFDLVYLDDNVQIAAIQAGVLEKIRPDDVPNMKLLYDQAKNKEGYGPAMIFFSVAIAYNVKKFEEAGLPAPKSWSDLWNPKLAGHIGVPTLDNTMGHAFLVAAEYLNGGNEGTPEKGIAKIATLKAQSYPQSSSVIEALMTSGDVWVIPWMNGRTWGLIDKGQPLKFVIPSDGAFAGYTTIDVVKGTPHEKEALAYINYVLDPLAQLGQANEVPYGPTNKVLAPVLAAYPKLAQKFPSSPEDIAKLRTIDWVVFNKVYPQAVSLWNREVVSK